MYLTRGGIKKSQPRPIHNKILTFSNLGTIFFNIVTHSADSTAGTRSGVLSSKCQTPTAIRTIQVDSSECPPSHAWGYCSRTCRLDPGDEFTGKTPKNVEENDEQALGPVSLSSLVEMLGSSTAKTVVLSRGRPQ